MSCWKVVGLPHAAGAAKDRNGRTFQYRLKSAKVLMSCCCQQVQRFQDLEVCQRRLRSRARHSAESDGAPPQVMVELARNNRIVYVSAIIRAVETKGQADDMTGEIDINLRDDVGGYIPQAHYRCNARKYVSGQLEYFPIRWRMPRHATKAQGLCRWIAYRSTCAMDDEESCDDVCEFVSCRTIEGLRIIGRPKMTCVTSAGLIEGASMAIAEAERKTILHVRPRNVLAALSLKQSM